MFVWLEVILSMEVAERVARTDRITTVYIGNGYICDGYIGFRILSSWLPDVVQRSPVCDFPKCDFATRVRIPSARIKAILMGEFFTCVV